MNHYNGCLPYAPNPTPATGICQGTPETDTESMEEAGKRENEEIGLHDGGYEIQSL